MDLDHAAFPWHEQDLIEVERELPLADVVGYGYASQDADLCRKQEPNLPSRQSGPVLLEKFVLGGNTGGQLNLAQDGNVSGPSGLPTIPRLGYANHRQAIDPLRSEERR